MTLSLLPRDPRIHVFSVSDGALTLAHQTYLSLLDEAPAEATPLPQAFGAEVNPVYAEVFAVADIQPLSLRDYLAQAHDIPPGILAADAARLDGLSGDVVVLAARAVEGLASLDPVPELTHIGSYATVEADNRPRSLPPAAKDPASADPVEASLPNGLPRGLVAGIVAVALLLAALLVWAIV